MGQELIEFWDPTIKKAGLDDTVMVVVTNSNKFKDINVIYKAGQKIEAEEKVLSLVPKETEDEMIDQNEVMELD